MSTPLSIAFENRSLKYSMKRSNVSYSLELPESRNIDGWIQDPG